MHLGFDTGIFGVTRACNNIAFCGEKHAKSMCNADSEVFAPICGWLSEFLLSPEAFCDGELEAVKVLKGAHKERGQAKPRWHRVNRLPSKSNSLPSLTHRMHPMFDRLQSLAAIFLRTRAHKPDSISCEIPTVFSASQIN